MWQFTPWPKERMKNCAKKQIERSHWSQSFRNKQTLRAPKFKRSRMKLSSWKNRSTSSMQRSNKKKFKPTGCKRTLQNRWNPQKPRLQNSAKHWSLRKKNWIKPLKLLANTKRSRIMQSTQSTTSNSIPPKSLRSYQRKQRTWLTSRKKTTRKEEYSFKTIIRNKKKISKTKYKSIKTRSHKVT